MMWIWGRKKLTDEDLQAIEAEMKKICKENLPLKAYALPRDEAIALMQSRGEEYKVEHIGDLPEDAAHHLLPAGRLHRHVRRPAHLTTPRP